MPGLILDFETASDCDLKAAGSWRYAEDLTTEVLSLSWGYEHQRTVGSWTPADGKEMPRALQEAIDNPKVLLVAHKADFEKAIWRRQMVDRYGWPDVPNSGWHDTLAVCAMRCIPLALDGACRALNLPFQKYKEGSKLTIGMSKVNKAGYYERDPETIQRSVIYNIADIDAQRGLHERIGWLPEGERRIWLMNQRINERGNWTCRLSEVCSALWTKRPSLWPRSSGGSRAGWSSPRSRSSRRGRRPRARTSPT